MGGVAEVSRLVAGIASSAGNPEPPPPGRDRPGLSNPVPLPSAATGSSRIRSRAASNAA